ncbi:MAG: hypothetical protein AABW67_01135 [Nanoarchaeota archaeon]
MANKKRSPKEVFENAWGGSSHLERAYIKYPGEEPIDVGRLSTKTSVWRDIEKVDKLWKEHKKIGHLGIHTHISEEDKPTYASGIPSEADFTRFIIDYKKKVEVIVQQDPETRKVAGYFIFKKRKGSQNYSRLKKPSLLSSFLDFLFPPGLSYEGQENTKKEIKEELKAYMSDSSEDRSPKKTLEELKKFTENHDLGYRFVPAKGYEFNEDQLSFALKNKKTLEVKVASIIGISFLASIILFSSNITGFAIANLTPRTSNLIGVMLFIIGLIGTFYYFKKKK